MALVNGIGIVLASVKTAGSSLICPVRLLRDSVTACAAVEFATDFLIVVNNFVRCLVPSDVTLGKRGLANP